MKFYLTLRPYDEIRLWSVATKDYANPRQAVRDYRLRWQIEERYSQLKESWLAKNFNATCFTPIVAHIIFSLMVYAFIQAYLNISNLKKLANKTIETLKADEAVGKDPVIMYAGGYYAVLDASESLCYVAFLEGVLGEGLSSLGKTNTERITIRKIL